MTCAFFKLFHINKKAGTSKLDIPAFDTKEFISKYKFIKEITFNVDKLLL